MKKLMRIALVFALAGATLVGCTKDYSGDISDLNKKVSEQQAAVTALQSAVSNAQTAADAAAQKAAEALAEAQKKATPADVQAAEERVNAKINDLVNGDVKALKEAVAALEGIKADERLTALETAIKDFVTKAELAQELAKLKGELEATIAAGDKANADEIEKLQGKFDELLAKVEGNFSVTAIEETATYAYAVWAPETTSRGNARYAKLAKAFPALNDLKKGDVVEMFGALPFIVNPSTVVFDDTYKFSLVGKTGEDTGIILCNPTQGYAVKGGANVWNVEVQGPAYDAYGPIFNEEVDELSLVVENANGVAVQTAFDYTLYAYKDNGTIFDLVNPGALSVQYHSDEFVGNTIDLKHILKTQDHRIWWFVADQSAPIYYFVLEATDEAQIEKYGVSVEGTKVTIAKGPEATDLDAAIDFTLTAIGVNGKTDEESFKLTVRAAAIEANADLGAKEITLTTQHNYVKYNVADFGFSALAWSEVFEALKNNGSVILVDEDMKPNNCNIAFFKNGSEVTPATYKDADAFGFDVNEITTAPGTYVVTIKDSKVFKGVGTLTISNPEACPVHLAEALCDADGVLQIVGSVNDGFITYELDKAVIAKDGANIQVTSFVDEDREYTDDWSWVTLDGKTFRIPVQDGKWVPANAKEPAVKLLYTPRNFSVTFSWFGNSANPGVFEFKAQAVSAIYTKDGSNITIDATKTTAYFKPDQTKGESASIDLTKVLQSGKYVAGELKGTEFKGFYYSEAQPEKEEVKNEQVNYNDPKLVTCSATIANTTNLVQNKKYVVNNEGKFVQMSLEDALSMNFINATDFAYCSEVAGYKFYLNEDDYKEMFNEWEYYYYLAWIKDGNNVCAKPTEVAALTGSEKAKVDKFLNYAALIDFNKTLNGVKIITSGKPAVEYSYGIETDPTFEFDTVEYGPYVTLNDDVISAKPTYAGQSDVTIPVTAKIKDIWGMTTKKTFDVVFKVK